MDKLRPNKRRTAVLSISMPIALKEMVDMVKDETGESRSAVISRLVHEGLKRKV